MDPQPMIVVATGGTAEILERPAAITRLPRHHVRDVDAVGVPGIHLHFIEVTVTFPEPGVRIHQKPVLAGIVRAIEATALPRPDHGVHPGRAAGCDRDTDTPEPVRRARKSGPDGSPRIASVIRLPQPIVLRAHVRTPAALPWGLPCGPQNSVNRLGVIGRDHHVHGSGVTITEQHALPACTAIT